MSEKPILFNTEMVQAILDGRKTQTRRPIKPQPDEDGLARELATGKFFDTSEREYRPPYREGDVLYVRETWSHNFYDEDLKRWFYWYKADCPTFPDDAPEGWIFGGTHPDKWHPSIHMPKDAARIWLRVKSVAVQRIPDISEEEARAEGVFPVGTSFKVAFWELWKKLYGYNTKWAWVIEFERVER